MPTPIYNIPTPNDLGSNGVWGAILNENTFRKFDQYLQSNPSQFLTINASGDNSSGYLQINDDASNYWRITHTTSGTMDFEDNDGGKHLTLTSGNRMYRYDDSGVTHNPGGIYIPLPSGNQIGDWIAASTASYTDVDVSDDGVPSGAVAVHCFMWANSIGGPGNTVLRARKNGESHDTNATLVAKLTNLAGTNLNGDEFVVPLDENLIFEARTVAGLTASPWECWVKGYFI
jgi:hypothetical protein